MPSQRTVSHDPRPQAVVRISYVHLYRTNTTVTSMSLQVASSIKESVLWVNYSVEIQRFRVERHELGK
jgi:hypothetical protein